MSENEVLFVWARRQWNDYRAAKFRLDDVSGLHWSDTSGGVRARSPHPMIYGYVSCYAVLEGELSHSCRHGRGPHYIKVCFTKKDNDLPSFSELSNRAGSKPGKGRFSRVLPILTC